MSYTLGTRSSQRLSGVHPDLVAVVKRAIQITEQDFSVLEGIRNINRQRELFKAGKSTTMNSRHLTGHAVDLAPWPISWEWEGFYPIAEAMKQAAEELEVDIVWGGAWHLSPFNGYEGLAEEAYEEYIEFCKSQGREPFGDGPHFELSRKTYP